MNSLSDHALTSWKKRNPSLKRLGFRVSPGSNESQGGGGLKLLPGAIGGVEHSRLLVRPSCVQGTYEDPENGSIRFHRLSKISDFV